LRHLAFASMFGLVGLAQALVYTNGPVTDGVNGSGDPISQLFAPASLFGAGGQIASNNWVAEDVTVTGDGWFVSRISIYSYQSNSTAFTFNSANIELTTGTDPNAGSSVLSLANAPVVNGGFVGYRVASTTPNVTNRPIYRVDVAIPNTFIPPGNYMLKWSLGGTLPAGPWMPPVAPFAIGNAYQSLNGGAFNPLIDSGLNQNIELPFEIEYFPQLTGKLYAVDSSRALFEVDMNTGVKTPAGTVSANAGTTGGLAYAHGTQTVYVTSTGNDSLYTLDLGTGTATLVGPYGDPAIVMHGLEWDDTTGTLYGVSSHNNGLYEISTVNGAATLIGTSTLTSFTNLGYDVRNNVFYASNSGADSLYTMDRSNGAMSLVGPLAGPTNPNGLAYDWIGDRLFLIDNSTDNLYTVNRATGQTTVVGSMGAGNTLGLVFIGPARIIGRIGLQDWGGAVAGRVVTLELYQGGVLKDARTTTLDQFGRYMMPTLVTPGVYNIYCKASHWLRRVRTPVVVTTAGALGVNFSLVNGDVDWDNEVAIGDYAGLSAAFGTSLGDPGFNPEADLNGDDEVTIGDYAILSANFGLIGD